LRAFFLQVFHFFSEFMRIQSKDHNDIVSSLITDHLFKIMLMKVDEILANNHKIIQVAIEDQKRIVRQMKKELEEELEKRDAKMRRVEADFAIRFTDLK